MSEFAAYTVRFFQTRNVVWQVGHTACVRALISLSFCGVSLVLILAPKSPAIAAEKTEMRTKAGAIIYRRHCASCHGKKLEGQPNWRKRKPNGRLPAPPHDASGHTWHHSDKQLFRITKEGTTAIVGDGYKSDMPGFKYALSDEEIQAVITFIKSTWPEQIRRRQNRLNRRRTE